MFTGLIQTIGTIAAIEKAEGDDTRFWIESDLDLTREAIGASIACSGACMTLIEKKATQFCISVSNESLSKTTLESWQTGAKINLESSLRAGDPLGGHFVTGHVDGLATVLDIQEEQGSHMLKIALPPEFIGFVAPKGSITLDGVSLTVNELGQDFFTINLIPHTWQHTIFHLCQKGTLLNFEVDLIARYLVRQMQIRV